MGDKNRLLNLIVLVLLLVTVIRHQELELGHEFSIEGNFGPWGIFDNVWRHFLVVTTWWETLLASSGWRPWMLLHILQCTAPSTRLRVTWFKTSTMLLKPFITTGHRSVWTHFLNVSFIGLRNPREQGPWLISFPNIMPNT